MDILEQLEQSETTPNANQETEFTNGKVDRGLSKRARKVLGTFSQVKAYTYDQEKYKWCEITFALPISSSFIMIMPVLQNLVKRCIIREALGIKRAFIKEEKGEIFVTTEGANIKELWKYNDKLDLNRLYTNDIVLLCNTYGIEAAYKAISKEITSVFKMYGIAIDSRHLSLIADYQTVDGVYRGCNRTSMECNPSPFQQMSFETPMKFLRDSMIGQQTDHMDSPSASIVTGQLVKSGTGSFDIIQRLF